MTHQRQTHIFILCLAFAWTASQSNSTTTPNPLLHVCGGEEWSCKGRCNEFRSLPCSCDIRCLVYRTCCEDYTEVCDYASNSNFLEIRKFFNKTMSITGNYVFISQCIDKKNSEDVELCEKTSSGMNRVTDRKLGLQFRNGICSKCNGLPEFISWNEKAVCEKAYFAPFGIVNITSIKESCTMRSQLPDLSLIPFSPVYRLQTAPEVYHCSEEYRRLCSSFYSMVSVTSQSGAQSLFNNRYCLICSGVKAVTECSVPEIREDEVHHPTQFISWINWAGEGKMNISTRFEDSMESVETTCDVKVTMQESCKIFSCPERSIAVFNSSYCLPVPIPVHVILEVEELTNDSEPITSQAFETFSSGCWFNGTFEITVNSLSVLLLCNWSTTSFSNTQQLKTLYNELSTTFQPNIGKSQIKNMKTAFLSVYGLPISETASVYTSHQFPNLTSNIVWTLATIGSALSLVSLCSRITIQPFSHLLNSQPGRMQCCLCVSLALAYVSFLLTQGLQQDSLPCWVVSILMHLSYLCSLFWMNAITVDLWKRFRYGRILSSNSERRSMKLIVLYTCLLPLAIVGVSVSMDLVLPNNEFSPAYGQHLCWINNSYSLVIFFVVPVSFLSFANIVLILLSFKSFVHRKNMSVFIDDSESSPVLSIGVVGIMTILTGITWLLGVLAGLVDNTVLWIIFSVVNSTYGMIVALLLMCNRRIWLSLEIPCRKRDPGMAHVLSGAAGPIWQITSNASNVHTSTRIRSGPDGEVSSVFTYDQNGLTLTGASNGRNEHASSRVSDEQDGSILSVHNSEQGGELSSEIQNEPEVRTLSVVGNEPDENTSSVDKPQQDEQCSSTVANGSEEHISSGVDKGPDEQCSSDVANRHEEHNLSCVGNEADVHILSDIDETTPEEQISSGVDMRPDEQCSKGFPCGSDEDMLPGSINQPDENALDV